MTGERGVTKDRVTWSSCHGGVFCEYQLNSKHAWHPDYDNTNQWIQVRQTYPLDIISHLLPINCILRVMVLRSGINC